MVSAAKVIDAAIHDLVPSQRRVVEWDEGPLLVLAGPGSGKTRTLTTRIAHVLASSERDKFKILALTFTNKAADEMRSRVAALVPEQLGRVFIGTFHSFCADVLRQHGGHLGVRPDFGIYATREDQEAVLRDALERVRNDGVTVGHLDTSLVPVIERLHSQLVSPADAAHHVASDSLRSRIGAIYTAYDEALTAHNALDFASLVYRTVELFRRFPAFGQWYANVYPHWCIDEFQDTNASQYALIRLMAGDTFRNLVAVADDDQIIYQWNGASVQRLEELQRDFEPAIIQLPTNHRCPPRIVELANNLIQHNARRMPDKVPVEAAKPVAEQSIEVVRLGRGGDADAEARVVAADIMHHHANELDRVVVLARSRWLLERVLQAVHGVGLKATIAQRRDEFESPEYAWLHACLRQAHRRQDRRNLDALCGSSRQLGLVDISAEAVVTAADAGQNDYLTQWCEHALSNTDSESNRRPLEIVRSRLIAGVDHRAFMVELVEWFEARMSSSGDAPVSYAVDAAAWREIVPEIHKQIGDRATLDEFLHALDLRSKAPTPTPDTVVLMTIAASKGKEFDHVYVVGLAQDQLPSYYARKEGPRSPEMEEERRNCFVAITRASRTLTLTFADTYRGYAKAPSQFLVEMGLMPPPA